jgi:hypothetical protein
MVLPPDLSRLGDELAAAAARSIAARRHRRSVLGRGMATTIAAILTVAVLSPAALGPGQRMPLIGGDHSALASLSVDRGCDQPRGQRFGLPACGHTASAPERAPAPMSPRRYPSRI